MKEFILGNKKIGLDYPPYIIAEMSGNHNHSLESALAIVRAAAKAGVDAIKLQTYTADTMTIDCKENEFFISDTASLWYGKSLYDLYQSAYTPWEWHGPLFKLCKELGIDCFSTPFDATAVEFLERLNMPCYKIASFENTDLPLIEKVARTGKPVILSTGIATVGEIEEAVKTLNNAGCERFVLLKCTSSYPASPVESNIATLPHMQQLFNCITGVSDHTLGIGVAVASIALGARVIEKHVTLSRKEGGVDAAFSLEPDELAQLVVAAKQAWQGIGKVSYTMTENENKNKIYRRSIYVVSDVKKGEIFNEKNVRCIRPSLGLPPKYFELILGKKANKAMKKGTPLNLNSIDFS